MEAKFPCLQFSPGGHLAHLSRAYCVLFLPLVFVMNRGMTVIEVPVFISVENTQARQTAKTGGVSII